MTRRQFDIALAAGGTGGHVIPAQALAAELLLRGHRPLFFTDKRGLRFAHLFPDMPSYEVASAPARGGVIGRMVAAARIGAGTLRALGLLRRLRPAAVVGFGGYPTVPSGLAAVLFGIPLCLHEQNAVFGRSNRLLARAARAISLSFAETRRIPASAAPIKVTGNPVRPSVTATPYEAPAAGGEFRLFIIGGSQGATVLSDVVPAAISALPKGSYSRLKVTQQARAEDIARVRKLYDDLGVEAEVAAFIDDLPQRLQGCHLMIARAGASTVSELAVAGRPSVLIPFPAATDDHQTANAAELVRAGGAWTIAQRNFTPATLAKLLQSLMRDPAKLEAAAQAALATARADAAVALADFVEQTIMAHGPLAALPLQTQEREAA